VRSTIANQFRAARAALHRRREELQAELKEINAALAGEVREASAVEPSKASSGGGRKGVRTGVVDFVRARLSVSRWMTSREIHGGSSDFTVQNVSAVLSWLAGKGEAINRGKKGLAFKWRAVPSVGSRPGTRTGVTGFCRQRLGAALAPMSAKSLHGGSREFGVEQVRGALNKLFLHGKIDRFAGPPYLYAAKPMIAVDSTSGSSEPASGHDEIPIDEAGAA